MSTPEVVREAQSAQNYNPLAKQKAAAKLSRIPVKVEQAPALKKPEWIRVKAGNYLGLTITVTATSREQLDALYRALSTHPMVKVVL